MKKIIALGCFLIACITCQGQNDSLTVFFKGNTKNEKFKVYFEGKLVLSFKANKSYKYSFKIPRKSSWQEKGRIVNLSVYRKGKMGLKFKEIGLGIPFENKKYLVIWRNPLLKNRAAIQINWSDKEPLQMPDV